MYVTLKCNLCNLCHWLVVLVACCLCGLQHIVWYFLFYSSMSHICFCPALQNTLRYLLLLHTLPLSWKTWPQPAAIKRVTCFVILKVLPAVRQTSCPGWLAKPDFLADSGQARFLGWLAKPGFPVWLGKPGWVAKPGVLADWPSQLFWLTGQARFSSLISQARLTSQARFSGWLAKPDFLAD